MSNQDEDPLKLKAAIEFGSEYMYTIKNGGHGRTLVVDAFTQERAHEARKKIPSNWKGLYVMVVYTIGLDEDYWEDDAPTCSS